MGKDPTGYVFLTRVGTRVKEATGGTELLNLFANTDENNEHKEFAVTPYDIRHFVSTWGAEQGGDLAAQMPGFMAHSVKTRDKYYNHAQGTTKQILCSIVMLTNSLQQLIAGYDKVKASEKFHQEVLEVELEANPAENDSRLVRHKKLVIEKQNELREARKNKPIVSDGNNAATPEYGKRTTLSPEERRIVHAAFSNLDLDNDLTSSGLLKFASIEAFAKKNEELKKVINDLFQKKNNMSSVKCIIQASVRNKTKALARAALIKKMRDRKTTLQPVE